MALSNRLACGKAETIGRIPITKAARSKFFAAHVLIVRLEKLIAPGWSVAPTVPRSVNSRHSYSGKGTSNVFSVTETMQYTPMR